MTTNGYRDQAKKRDAAKRAAKPKAFWANMIATGIFIQTALGIVTLILTSALGSTATANLPDGRLQQFQLLAVVLALILALIAGGYSVSDADWTTPWKLRWTTIFVCTLIAVIIYWTLLGAGLRAP
ncbi:hypothetical protein BWO91_16975 [Plantibacter flavus]|uniref:hypothetical protein n=1 Tax=Plantibacter flavus TaxID=150123 RepID=UPI00099DA0F2|nr:hypothetical protein [Plantibacter flavus]AQX81425.1 hypothetical protein BWO91_16975 [Plantibacter flavus]